MVGSEDNRPARVPGPVEQRHEVLDGLGAPFGTDRVGPVEGVVDGVQHTRHQGVAGHVADGGGDVVGQGVAEPRRVQRLLVEQRRTHQTVRAGQRLIAALLDVPATRAQLPTQQGGTADLGDRGQGGERSRPARLPGQQRLGPAVAGP